jgi:hypothetical protein
MGRLIVGVVGVLAVGGAVLYACVPRHADLRAFEPAAMAEIETQTWRKYYARSYLELFFQLYALPRTQFGFSPLDSLKIALASVKAARIFQPSTSREQAFAALPSVVTYYSLLRPAAPVAFDVEAVARLEVGWWQARREAVGPGDYGLNIAEEAALMYGKDKDDPVLVASGVARAQAMAYRDARGSAITEADWSNIEMQLNSAYALLKSQVE